MLTSDATEVQVEEDRGLVFALLLDGQGSGRLLDWAGVEKWSPKDGPLWLHFNGEATEVSNWLKEHSGLTEKSAKAMLEPETRPRIVTTEDGLLAILRGINLNVGEDPYDMVALRMSVAEDRLITIRAQPMKTPREVLADFLIKGVGPATIPQLFQHLTERLTERMNAVVVELDEKLDGIEELLEKKDSASLRSELNDVRYAAVGLRRYIGPQREALSRLQLERPPWLTRDLEGQFREAGDKLQRYIEDLDAAKDRSLVIRDEISNRLAEAMNQRMYALSIITGVFLPLGLLTGLLGINVGGMPGTESGWAFWITCGVLLLVVIGELILFRRLKWI